MNPSLKTNYDIIVVGGGPAGSIAARTAAQNGVSVLLLEKDRDIGYPVRCGEAVSKIGLTKFIQPNPKWIAATISKFNFVAPDETEATIDFGESGYVLERRIFDYELARTAADAGASILTRAYVHDLIKDKSGNICGVRFEYQGEKEELRCKVVIAADGVESRVGRWAGLQTHIDFRDMESAVQITAANIPINNDTLYFYFGKNVAPHGYFWIFPKGDNKANIGLGVSGLIGKQKSALSYLNDFMEKHYPTAPILTQIAGGVPCSVTLEKISAPGIMLVGDAARQVNPLSGGGITSGMIGGEIAGEIAADAIKKNNLSLIMKYDKAWKDRQGGKHEIYNRIKEGIYNFDDEKFNAIAKSFSKIPLEKRTLGALFRTALFNQPSLLIDIAKVFI